MLFWAKDVANNDNVHAFVDILVAIMAKSMKVAGKRSQFHESWWWMEENKEALWDTICDSLNKQIGQ